MAYEMKCPLCGQEMSIDADSEAEAMAVILEEGKKHVDKVHKDFPVDEDMLKQLIQSNLRKT